MMFNCEPGFDCIWRSVGLGFVLLLFVVLIALLFWGWTRAWAWIDDSKPADSPMGIFLRKIWRIKRRDDTWSAYFWAFFLAFWLPSTIALLLSYPTFFMSVGTLIALAFSARYGRRLHKKFMTHVEDKDAHK